jgi:hypothetical protein
VDSWTVRCSASPRLLLGPDGSARACLHKNRRSGALIATGEPGNRSKIRITKSTVWGNYTGGLTGPATISLAALQGRGVSLT